MSRRDRSSGSPEDPDAAQVPSRDRSSMLLVVMSSFGVQAMATLTGIISARMLGVEGRGEVALVAVLSTTGAQLGLGSLPNVIARQLAMLGISARDGLRGFVNRWLLWALLISLAVGAYLLLVLPSSTHADPSALALVLVVLTFQMMALRVIGGAIQGEGDVVRLALLAITPQGLFTVVLTVAFLAGWDWTSLHILLAQAASAALTMALGLKLLAKPTAAPDDVVPRDELYGDMRRTYLGSVGPIDGLGLDRILLGSLAGSAALGLYSAAMAIASLSSLVGGAMAVLVLPKIAASQVDPTTEPAVVAMWIRRSTVFVACVVVLLELIAAPTIRLAFGEEFTGATTSARLLILAFGILGFRRVLIAVLQARGSGGSASWIEFYLTPLVLVGVVVASMHESIVGVAVTMLVVSVLAVAALGRAVLRSARVAGTSPESLPSP